MNNQEYEQKKRECWKEFCKEHPLDATANGGVAFSYAFDRAYALGKQEKDAEDADGEEMLTVSRKEVQELFANAKKHHDLYTSATCINESESRTIDVCLGRIQVLDTLFGSKCLPDESESPKFSKVEKVGKDCNVDSLPTNVDSSDDCKAEPKFKVGDIVRFKYCCTTYQIDGFKISDGVMLYQVGKVWVEESDIEPYTEPKNESRNLSKNIANCDKQLDNILKDSFRNERRLNIATTIMAGVMANPNIIKSRGDLKAISNEWLASRTLELADTLISECAKGGSDGN